MFPLGRSQTGESTSPRTSGVQLNFIRLSLVLLHLHPIQNVCFFYVAFKMTFLTLKNSSFINKTHFHPICFAFWWYTIQTFPPWSKSEDFFLHFELLHLGFLKHIWKWCTVRKTDTALWHSTQQDRFNSCCLTFFFHTWAFCMIFIYLIFIHNCLGWL